jgi:hypothetical protein
MAILMVALAALTVGVWWVWLGSDTEYRIDPMTQASSGPYEAPQVIACVLCLLVLAVAASVFLPAWSVVVTLTVPFVATWSINAAAADGSGLWTVGAVLLALAMAAGTAAVAMGTGAVRRHYWRRAP